MRVRASAGAGSYRGRDGLERALDAARRRVLVLRAELEADPAAASRRLGVAPRACRAGARRGPRAGPRTAARRSRSASAAPTTGGAAMHPREASTSDAEVDFMGFADGGRRPAWNVQLATDAGERHHRRRRRQRDHRRAAAAAHGRAARGPLWTGTRGAPRRWRIRRPQSARAPRHDLWHDHLHARQPTPQRLPAQIRTCHAGVIPPRWPSGACAWAPTRPRPSTGCARQSAECSNADLRNHGLRAFNVRGRPKALAVLLWQVLAHNLVRVTRLRASRCRHRLMRDMHEPDAHARFDIGLLHLRQIQGPDSADPGRESPASRCERARFGGDLREMHGPDE